jgi:predicted aspartyl protease
VFRVWSLIPILPRWISSSIPEVYSVVPGDVLEGLGIRPSETRSFYLADGQQIRRQTGLAVFGYRGQRTAAPVIFGAPGDSPLMGATTLEGFGFVLDPFRRELRPAVMRI